MKKTYRKGNCRKKIRRRIANVVVLFIIFIYNVSLWFDFLSSENIWQTTRTTTKNIWKNVSPLGGLLWAGCWWRSLFSFDRSDPGCCGRRIYLLFTLYIVFRLVGRGDRKTARPCLHKYRLLIKRPTSRICKSPWIYQQQRRKKKN